MAGFSSKNARVFGRDEATELSGSGSARERARRETCSAERSARSFRRQRRWQTSPTRQQCRSICYYLPQEGRSSGHGCGSLISSHASRRARICRRTGLRPARSRAAGRRRSGSISVYTLLPDRGGVFLHDVHAQIAFGSKPLPLHAMEKELFPSGRQ